MKGRGETILIVDDEEHIRGILCDILEAMNYRVLTACDGMEALQLFSEYHADISLMITDVVMPKIGGLELAKHIRYQNPHIPVIYITGFSRNDMMMCKDKVAQSLVFKKPFSYDDMIKAIRIMIDMYWLGARGLQVS